MRAILVSVDYADLLEITLPYNKHHFDAVVVVTSQSDRETQDVAAKYGARLFLTSTFYANGASFNKWAALEEGLNWMGREGWICLMDADVLWPKNLTVEPEYETLKMWVPTGPTFYLDRGQLCSPLRRMCSIHEGLTAASEPNSERWWNRFPIHRNVAEWAGYSQIFHAEDPALGPAPWHEVDWEHAGGADSFFQAKWPADRKVRPTWECLHIGEAGKNWYGRATERIDGSIHLEAAARKLACHQIWQRRRDRRSKGLDPYADEKLN